MKGTTHLLFGLILAAVLTEYFAFQNQLLAIILILFASIIPDIDESHSILGRHVPLIGFFFAHRTFFHSIAFGVTASIGLFFILPVSYMYAFMIGFGGHLLLDALTPMGVRPFWPSKLRMKGFIRVGGFLEHVIVLMGIIVFIWVLLR